MGEQWSAGESAPIEPEDRQLICLGFGYTAEALARRLLALGEGWRVVGTTRRPEKAVAMSAMGVAPILIADNAQGAAEAAIADVLEEAPFVLVSAAPSASGEPTLSRHGRALERAAAGMRWLGYLSTTGVYGDRGGAWVDETSDLSPSTERGRLRVEAEAAWAMRQRGGALPLHIFRLAGIYGPGRGPFEKLRSGSARRVVKEGQVFSRIHVDDIAQVLEASMRRPNPGAVYNVCDDDPAPPQQVIGCAASMLELTPPPEIPFEQARAEMSPMAVSFYAESKKVRNERIKQELGVSLLYPSYREGLEAILEVEEAE